MRTSTSNKELKGGWSGTACQKIKSGIGVSFAPKSKSKGLYKCQDGQDKQGMIINQMGKGVEWKNCDNFGIYTLKMCQDRCDRTPDCEWVMFDQNQKRCNKNGYCIMRTNTYGTKMIPWKTGNPAIVGGTACIKQNFDYCGYTVGGGLGWTGGNQPTVVTIKDYTRNGWEKCCFKCKKTAQCCGWIYQSGGRCQMRVHSANGKKCVMTRTKDSTDIAGILKKVA